MLSKEEFKKYVVNPTIQICFDYIFPISEDRVLATHGDEISLITNDGTLLCTYDSIEVPEYFHDEDTQIDENNNYFNEGRYVDKYLLVRDCGYLGVIDYDGDVVIDPQYRYIKFVGEDKIECF